MEARDDDFVNQLFVASTHSFVFFFSDRGKVYVKKVFEVPAGSAHRPRAAPSSTSSAWSQANASAPSRPCRGFEEDVFVTTLTRRGQIKKTSIIDYQNYRRSGIIGVKIADDDQLLTARGDRRLARVPDRDEEGQEHPLRREPGARDGPQRRGRQGHRARRRRRGRRLAHTEPERDQVLAICERGYGKRTKLDEFRRRTAAARASS